jgi:hypothetical protein
MFTKKSLILIIILFSIFIIFGCIENNNNTDNTSNDNNEFNLIDNNQEFNNNSFNVLDKNTPQQPPIEKDVNNFESQKSELIEELIEKFGSTDNLSFDSIILYLEKYGPDFCSVLENQENISFCENYYANLSIYDGKPDKNLCEFITNPIEKQICFDKTIVLANTINYFKIYPEQIDNAWNKVELPLKEFDFSNCVLVTKENNKYCINPFNAVGDRVFGLKYNFLGWVYSE